MFYIVNTHSEGLKGCLPIGNKLFFPPKNVIFPIERNITKSNIYTCILVFWIGKCRIVSLWILTLEQFLYSGYTYTSCWFHIVPTILNFSNLRLIALIFPNSNAITGCKIYVNKKNHWLISIYHCCYMYVIIVTSSCCRILSFLYHNHFTRFQFYCFH